MAASQNPPITFATCGEMLKFLRRRARLSLRELSIAVGYSESHLSRIENNTRAIDRTTLLARFAPALDIQHEPELVAQLLTLCAAQETVRTDDPGFPPAASLPTTAAPEHPPAPAGADSYRWPLQLTSFIGRAEEVVEVCDLLRTQQARLVTLTGAGGCGKTRLALRVADELEHIYADGVHRVELAALLDPQLAAMALATAVGFHNIAGEATLPALVDSLRTSHCLLLLDNCEHLIEAVADLALTLLLGCPHLHILTTSREALGVPGEFIHQVQPLALPALQVGAQPSAAAIAHFDSVRLFVERAHAAQHTFALTDQNAPAVARICHRLDGIPLCIELAAAWITTLTPEQIAARLEHDLALLTSESRRSLPRHRTLQAAIDWSYNLLSAPEQALLRRLALFRGGWSLDAAEAIVADAVDAPRAPSTIARSQVLLLLRQLTNKSLITIDAAASDARYRLLEPLREVLYTKLSEAGEETALHERHLAFYARLAAAAEVGLASADQQQWLDRLETEHDNLRLALKWGSEHSRASAATMAQLAAHIWRFWLVRGHYAEGRHWLELALANGDFSDPVRVRLLYGAGVLARLQLDLSAARRFAAEQQRLARQLGDRQGIADSYGVMGWVEEFLGEYQKALKCFNKRLALSKSLGNQRGVAYALRGLGETATALGMYNEAEAWLNQALTLFLQLGDRRYAAQLWNDLGRLAHGCNQPEIADACFQLSLTTYRSVHDRHGMTAVSLNLAALALTQQDTLNASAHLEAAAHLLRGMVDKLLLACLWSTRARLAYHHEEWATAEAAAKEALRLRCTIDQRPGIVAELDLYAAITLARRQARRAVCLWSAVEHFRRIMQMPLPPRDEPSHRQQLELARAQLAPAAFNAAWRMGQHMTWEQLIVYASDGNV